MKAFHLLRSFALIFAPLTLLVLSLLAWTGSSQADAALQDESPGLPGESAAQAELIVPPPDLGSALERAFGHYERLAAPADFLKRLQTAQIVCIGEAHYEARDMQTAFEIVRLLAQRRTVALAVERLSHNLQPRLDSLGSLPGDGAVAAELQSILLSDDYQKVWGSHLKDRSGFPTNTPSQPVFEAMLQWAAQARIPLLGLDVSLADRARGLGENIPYRSELWTSEIEAFLASHRQDNYLIVVVAGVSHCDGSSDSFATRIKASSGANRVISVGQRDAMYGYQSSAQVEMFARIYGLGDLIVYHPQVAVVSVKGVAEFPDPPDYWIATHTPDSWN